jgi:hypothetical protein
LPLPAGLRVTNRGNSKRILINVHIDENHKNWELCFPETIGGPETSVRNYHSTPRNNPEGRSFSSTSWRNPEITPQKLVEDYKFV